MAIFADGKFLCECGCDTEINFWSTWSCGHHMRSEEHRKRNSKVHLGTTLSPGHCDKISEAHKVIWANRTAEEVEKIGGAMSEAKMGIPQSEEHRRVNSESNMGHLVSRETRGKISEILTGRTLSEDHRASISRTMQGRYQGEENPNWKGGFVGGYGYGWWAIREGILERDNYTCQGCKTKLGLVVHHIDGDIDNLEEQNLITVCRSCNNKAASKYWGNYWREFYGNKIKEIYAIA